MSCQHHCEVEKTVLTLPCGLTESGTQVACSQAGTNELLDKQECSLHSSGTLNWQLQRTRAWREKLEGLTGRREEWGPRKGSAWSQPGIAQWWGKGGERGLEGGKWTYQCSLGSLPKGEDQIHRLQETEPLCSCQCLPTRKYQTK